MPRTDLSIVPTVASRGARPAYPAKSGVARRLIVVLALASCFVLAIDSPRTNRSSVQERLSCNPFLPNDPCRVTDLRYKQPLLAPD